MVRFNQILAWLIVASIAGAWVYAFAVARNGDAISTADVLRERLSESCNDVQALDGDKFPVVDFNMRHVARHKELQSLLADVCDPPL